MKPAALQRKYLPLQHVQYNFSFCLPRTQLYPDSDRNTECRLRESLPDLV